MLYLLDANVLIDANRDYYPMERVPEFWEWLEYQGQEGRVKIPIEIYEEITNSLVADWLAKPDIKSALQLREDVDPEVVADIIDTCYADDLTDDEVIKIGRDPFLVAHAAALDATIVTTEGTKPRKTRANRHLPDAGKDYGLLTINTYEFIKKLDFSTSWKMLL